MVARLAPAFTNYWHLDQFLRKHWDGFLYFNDFTIRGGQRLVERRQVSASH